MPVVPLKKNPYRLPDVALMSFSGGRTSGYLVRKILDAFDNQVPTGLIFGFSNTGKEDERTLEFVKETQDRWGIEVWWVEYFRNEDKPATVWRGKQPLVGQHDWRLVSFETASRNGEPFEQLIDSLAAYRADAKGEPPVLPNPVQRMCSSELKIRTLGRFMNEGLKIIKYPTALGIRYDEPSRVAPLLACGRKWGEHLLPLYDMRVTEPQVMEFWSSQPFDLGLKHDDELGTYEGNCDFCFLKAVGKIKRLSRERPEGVKWWADQEVRTGANFRKGRFTYTDIVEGRVELGTVCATDNHQGEQEACFCTD